MFPVALGISLFLLQAQTAVYGAGIVPQSARRIPGLRLRGRNLPIIPAACNTGCAPFAPFLGGESCPVTQCCSMIFQEGYFECFKCVGTTTNATDFSIAQEYVDVVTTSCSAEGIPLPVLTLPGQNPDRTLVSALPPGASGIPVFPAEAVVRSSPPSTAPPRSSAATVSHVSSSQSGFSVGVSRGPSNSVSHVSSSQSGLSVAPQSSATAPAPSSAPSPTGSAPPSAGVRSQVYTPMIGVVVTALLALLV